LLSAIVRWLRSSFQEWDLGRRAHRATARWLRGRLSDTLRSLLAVLRADAETARKAMELLVQELSAVGDLVAGSVQRKARKFQVRGF